MKASPSRSSLCSIFGLFVIALLASQGMCSCQAAPLKKPKTRPPVNVATIAKQDVPVYFDAIGQAIPPVTVQVRPQVAGRLLSTNVIAGAQVTAGDVLYKIDPRQYQAALDQAKATLAHDLALQVYAEKTVERYKAVVEEDYISKLTFEQYQSTAVAAKAQVEQDIAAVEAAQINLDFCDVVATVTGKVSYYNVDVGNVFVAYDTNAITTIRPNPPIDVIFSLPQDYFEIIRQTQSVEDPWKFIASLSGDPQHPYAGETYFIDNEIDQNTGTILLRGRLANLERELWPGEFVKVKVLQKTVSDCLTVPPGAILIGDKGPYLYTLDKNNKAAAVNVKIITRNDKYIAIESY